MALEDSSGRGVRNSYGPRKLTPHLDNTFSSNKGNFRRSAARFENALMHEVPTLRARPYDRADGATYSAITSEVTLATDIADPTTGLSMALATIPANNTSYHSVSWNDTVDFRLNEHDSWFISVYIPVLYSTLVVQVLVSDASSISGVNYRSLTFSANTNQVKQGWNILQCLHVEERVDAITYGRVGTTEYSPWVNTGGMQDSSSIKTIQVRTRTTANIAAPVEVYLGAVHTAPLGWATGAFLWMVDDVPESFYNLALPIIESYGWKCAFAITSGYMADPNYGSNSYVPRDAVYELQSRGHEIWGHTRLHDNMDTATTEVKTRSLTMMTNYYKSIGFGTAAQCLAWPFGAYDDESITIAESVGIKLARGIRSDGICPFVPGINRWNLPAYAIETTNSWRVDTMIRGSMLRGMGLTSYSHTAVEGGSTSNTRPASDAFYIDHMKRWCELIASYEAEGKLIVSTPLAYLKLCGIDPLVDTLLE